MQCWWLLIATEPISLQERLDEPARAAVRPLHTNNQVHVFIPEANGGTIEFRNADVIWRFSKERMQEIADKLESMKENPLPCHHYVDIVEPASMLILSRDEYPDRLI